MKPVIKYVKLNKEAKVPAYNTANDSGADLFAVEDTKWVPIKGKLSFPFVMVNNGMRMDAEVVLGYKAIVKTGLAVELPAGYEWQIRSRSGLAAKYNIQVKNSPGTIDNGYRNEIMVILECHGELPDEFKGGIPKGAKIAQGVIAKFETAGFEEVTELSGTERGLNGIGSSGVK